MTVLSMSAGLFLILGIHIGFLLDRLTEGYSWSVQRDLAFESGSQLARYNLQMLVSHAIEQGLAVLAVIYRP